MGGNIMAKKEIAIPAYVPVAFEKSGAQVIDELNKRLATIHELLSQIAAELKGK
jgi:bifunctional DNase/RNase